MPFKSKLPRLVVNRLRDPKLGSLTGVDVTKGKVIRKDDKGRDLFEDYFTEEESENEKTVVLPTEVVNRIRKIKQADSSIQSMSPFSETTSPSTVQSSGSVKAISEKVSVVIQSSTEKDSDNEEVFIQKDSEIIICTSSRDRQNQNKKDSSKSIKDTGTISNPSDCFQNGLPVTFVQENDDASKVNQHHTCNQKKLLQNSRQAKENVSNSLITNSQRSILENNEEAKNLKNRMSTYIYQLQHQDLAKEESPFNFLLKDGTADGSISKASFSKRGTTVKCYKKTKTRLSFSAAVAEELLKANEQRQRCEEAKEEPEPEELNKDGSENNSCQQISGERSNEDKPSCEQEIEEPQPEELNDCCSPATTCQQSSDSESNEEDLDLSKPFKFSFHKSKKELQNSKQKKNAQDTKNNHLIKKGKRKDSFDMTINSTPEAVGDNLNTSNGYIKVNWKIKEKDSRSNCSKRPENAKESIVVNHSKMDYDNILNNNRENRTLDLLKKQNSMHGKYKSKKDMALRKDFDKTKKQRKVNTEVDSDSIIDESVCSEYHEFNLDSLPELTSTNDEEKQDHIKKRKKMTKTKTNKNKKEETRSQDDSYTSNTSKKGKVNKLKTNQKRISPKQKQSKKIDESDIKENINDLDEDNFIIGSPEIQIAAWAKNKKGHFQKQQKSNKAIKQGTIEVNMLSDHSIIPAPSCGKKKKQEESILKKTINDNSLSLYGPSDPPNNDLVSDDENFGNLQNNENLPQRSSFQEQEKSKVTSSLINNCHSLVDNSLVTVDKSVTEKTKNRIKGGKEKKNKKTQNSKNVELSVVNEDSFIGENAEKENRWNEEESVIPKVHRKRKMKKNSVLNDLNSCLEEDSPLLRRAKVSNIIAFSNEENQSEINEKTKEKSSSRNSLNKKSPPESKRTRPYGVGKKNRKTSIKYRSRKSSIDYLGPLLKSTKKKVMRKELKLVPPEEAVDNNLRRSKRTKVRSLEFWRNERIEYRRDSTGLAVAGIISPENQKKKKHSKVRTKRNNKKSNIVPAHSDLADFTNNAENATPNQPVCNWIPETTGKGCTIPPNILKFMEIVKNRHVSVPIAPVPVINPETQTEVEINCISVKDSHNYVNAEGQSPSPNESLLICKGLQQGSFSSGFIVLAPFAEKGMQSVQNDSLVFVVISGEVLITIHETTGLVSEGDFFFIPSGNKYNIVNLQEKAAKLTYFRICGGSP